MQSKKDNESEFKNEFENSPNIRNPKNELDTPEITTIEIPHAVQEILRRIEQAQLLRAREVCKELQVYRLQHKVC